MPFYYRADKRKFVAGEIIGTAGDFITKHPEAGRLAEIALENGRPIGKPQRGSCLMLFEEEACARRYWQKMANGLLYTVTIDPSQILHRGDMRTVDDIAARSMGDADVRQLVDAYWAGELSDYPCVEILVNVGTVVDVVGSNAQRVEELRKSVIKNSILDEKYDIKELFGIGEPRDS